MTLANTVVITLEKGGISTVEMGDFRWCKRNLFKCMSAVQRSAEKRCDGRPTPACVVDEWKTEKKKNEAVESGERGSSAAPHKRHTRNFEF